MQKYLTVVLDMIGKNTKEVTMDEYGYPTGKAWTYLDIAIDSFIATRNDYGIEDLEKCLRLAPRFEKGWLLYLFGYLDYLTDRRFIYKSLHKINQESTEEIKLESSAFRHFANPRILDKLFDDLMNTFCELYGQQFQHDIELLKKMISQNMGHDVILRHLKNTCRKYTHNLDKYFKGNYFIEIYTPIGLNPANMPNPGIENS